MADGGTGGFLRHPCSSIGHAPSTELTHHDNSGRSVAPFREALRKHGFANMVHSRHLPMH